MVVVVADVATGVVVVVVVVVLMVVLVVFGGLGYATTELIEARARMALVEKRIMMTGGKTKGSMIEHISLLYIRSSQLYSKERAHPQGIALSLPIHRGYCSFLNDRRRNMEPVRRDAGPRAKF